MTYMSELYNFQITQIESDRELLKELFIIEASNMLNNTVLESLNINENTITNAIRSFFKWISEKIQSFIDFIRKIFKKHTSETTQKSDAISKKIDQVKEKPINITLDNVFLPDFDIEKYKKYSNMSNFKNIRVFDIVTVLTDYFKFPDQNKDELMINVPEFERIVNKGYSCAVKFTVPPEVKKMEDMKRFLKKEICGNDDIVMQTGVHITNKELEEYKNQIGYMDDEQRNLNKLISDNVKELERQKKILTSVEKTVSNSGLFDIFKTYSIKLVSLFNYNKDVLTILLSMRDDYYNSINSLINRVIKEK